MKLPLLPLLAACVVFSARAEERREVRIGAMAELSGQFASTGEDCRRGFQLAYEAFTDNGKLGSYDVKMLYGDHQRDAKIGVNEFNRLVNQSGVLAIATNASSVVMAINQMSRAKKIPLLASSAHPDFIKGNEYGFRFWIRADVEGGGLASKALSLGKKRAAVLTLEEDYPLAVSKGFNSKFKEKGGEIVFDEHILRTDVDFSPIATRLRSANADIIFINVIGDQLPVIIKKFREQGLKQQLFATFSMAKREYIDSAGHENANGTIYLEVNGDKPKFVQRLRDRFNVDVPSGLHYTCYSAVGFFLDALRRNPDIKNSDDLYAQLMSMKEVSLLDGPLALVEREAQLDYLFRTVKKGQIADL